MVERTRAHHHPDSMNKAKAAIADGMARLGAGSNPMLARLAKRAGEDRLVGAEALRTRRGRRHQTRHQEPEQSLDVGDHKPLKDMVDAAGIEPATPTMSRAEAALEKRRKSKQPPRLKIKGRREWR